MNLIVIFLNSQTTDQLLLQPLFTSSSTKRKNTRCWHSFLIKCPFLLRLIFPSTPPLLPFFLLTPKKCFNSFHSLCVCCVSPTIFCSIPNSSLSAVRLHPVVHHLSPDGRMSSTRHYFLLSFLLREIMTAEIFDQFLQIVTIYFTWSFTPLLPSSPPINSLHLLLYHPCYYNDDPFSTTLLCRVIIS